VCTVERGEVWWAAVDDRQPVVVLSVDGAEIRALQIVAPATADQRRGFAVLSGAQALDAGLVSAALGSAATAVGVEVAIDAYGVVRVGLARDGQIFCTWLVTLEPEHLLERAGRLSPGTLAELGNALALAGVEPPAA
jgi:mRNA interferase MazF